MKKRAMESGGVAAGGRRRPRVDLAPARDDARDSFAPNYDAWNRAGNARDSSDEDDPIAAATRAKARREGSGGDRSDAGALGGLLAAYGEDEGTTPRDDPPAPWTRVVEGTTHPYYWNRDTGAVVWTLEECGGSGEKGGTGERGVDYRAAGAGSGGEIGTEGEDGDERPLLSRLSSDAAAAVTRARDFVASDPAVRRLSLDERLAVAVDLIATYSAEESVSMRLRSVPASHLARVLEALAASAETWDLGASRRDAVAAAQDDAPPPPPPEDETGLEGEAPPPPPPDEDAPPSPPPPPHVVSAPPQPRTSRPSANRGSDKAAKKAEAVSGVRTISRGPGEETLRRWREASAETRAAEGLVDELDPTEGAALSARREAEVKAWRDERARSGADGDNPDLSWRERARAERVRRERLAAERGGG